MNGYRVTAFFKEFHELNDPDYCMSDESRLGFYILQEMVQQAAEFEILRLQEETGATQVKYSREPIPRDTYDALRGLLDRMQAYTEEANDDKPH